MHVASRIFGADDAMTPHFPTPSNLLLVPAMPTRKKTVADLADADLKGKKVLVRADLNVPLDVSLRHFIFRRLGVSSWNAKRM